MSFLDLPDNLSTASDDYENAVRARFDDLVHRWQPVSIIGDGGHQLDVEMSADAVMLDGVRINGTATFQREVGDVLGGYLMSPRLCDILFEVAQKQIPPQPHRTSGTAQMDDVFAMVEHSAKVDQLAEGAAFVADPCKDWVELESGAVRNYGWHTSPSISKSMGIPAQPAITPGLYVVQRPYNHGLDHSDYSQCLRFVRKTAKFDGRERDLKLIIAGSAEAAQMVFKPFGAPGDAKPVFPEPPGPPGEPPGPEAPPAEPPAPGAERPGGRGGVSPWALLGLPLVGLGLAVVVAKGAK